MDIVFMSNSGESLPIVWRLRREGINAGIYLHNPQYRRNYDGLLAKIPFRDLKKQLNSAQVIVFDITRPNEKTKQDVALLKLFGIKASAPSVFGPVADKLKKDHTVIGASAFTEQLELDRRKGAELAKEIGFALPEAHEFNTLKEAAKFLKGRKDLWVFKPHNNEDIDLTYVEKFAGELITKLLDEYLVRIGDDCEHMLQRKIEGTEVSSEVWIGKQGPVHFNHTVETKRLMDADLGPAIGSQSNTVWIERDKKGLLVSLLTKMASRLHKEGYIGPCDANCIISEGKPYFLEWSPRFGYDALYCLLSLVKGKLSDFFLKDFDVEFHTGYAASQRISIPPYPYSDRVQRKNYAEGVSILSSLKHMPFFWAEDVRMNADKLQCAGADGILGVVTGRGASLGAAWGSVYRSIRKLKVCSYLQYRTDGFKQAEKRTRGLKVA
jgi:phosphoribosylamine-glycine ligase